MRGFDYRVEKFYETHNSGNLNRTDITHEMSDPVSESEIMTAIGLGEYHGFVDLIIPGSAHDDGIDTLPKITLE